MKSLVRTTPQIESQAVDKTVCKYPGCGWKWSVAIGQHCPDSQGYCSHHAWSKPENAKWLLDRERNRQNFERVKELARWLPKKVAEVAE